MFSVFIVVSPFAFWLSPEKGKQKRPSSTEKTGYRFDLLGQKSENFCGATQIDNCLSAHDTLTRIFPCNGGNSVRTYLLARSTCPPQSIRQTSFCCTRTIRQLSGRNPVCLLVCINGFILARIIQRPNRFVKCFFQ